MSAMSLDHYLDCLVNLIEDDESGWHLQETDNEGNHIGSPQHTWNHDVVFFASEFEYQSSIKIDQDFPDVEWSEQIRLRNEKSFWTSLVEYSEKITGVLIPRSIPTRSDPTYSMFGTQREIKQFGLVITQAKEGEKDTASLWGHVSFDWEHEFEKGKNDDYFSINLSVAALTFQKIKKLVSDKRLDVASVCLKQCFGFYSDWSPDGYTQTEKIKILADWKDQGVHRKLGSVIEPTTLGFVREFTLTVHQEQHLDKNKFPHSTTTDNEYENDDVPANAHLDTNSILSQKPLSETVISVSLIRKILIPLWCIFAALVWIIFKK